jgi:hypothetical protein
LPVSQGKPNAIDRAAFLTGMGAEACRCSDTVVPFARRDSRVASAVVLAGVLVFGVLLTAGDGAALNRRPATTASTEAAPFIWLVGDWTSDPDAFGAETTLHLTIGTAAGKLVGALAAITPGGKRKPVVDFVITLTGDCPLSWHEAGLRYRFKLEGSGLSYALVPGDLTRVDAQRLLRFVHMRGPTRRTPFPIVIELRFNAGRLSLRRVQGPQHGAAVDPIYLFERAG